MTARPSTRDLSDFLANIDAGTDAPIRDALAAIAAHKAPYATSAQVSRMRRVAREAIYVATCGREADAIAAWGRLDRALTSQTDFDGSLHTTLKPLFWGLVRARKEDRAEYRAAELRRMGSLSHLPAEEQAYHREVRAMWAASRAA